MNEYINRKILKIRPAEDKEAETLGVEEDEPLMVAEIEGGTRLFLFSEESDDGAEVAIALNDNDELEELFEIEDNSDENSEEPENN